MSGDPIVPLTPAEGNVAEADLAGDRHATLDASEPHRLVETWRAEHLTDHEPPAGYLEET